MDLRAILWFNMLWIVVFSTTFLGVSNNCPKINRWLGSMWFHIYYTIQCVVYTFNTYSWKSIQQPHSWGVDPREAPKGFCFKTGFFSPPNAQQPPESESAVSWGWSYLTPAEPQQLGNFKHWSRESQSELQSQNYDRTQRRSQDGGGGCNFLTVVVTKLSLGVIFLISHQCCFPTARR